MPAMPARDLLSGSGARGFSAHSAPFTARLYTLLPVLISALPTPSPCSRGHCPGEATNHVPTPPPQGGPSLPHLCWCPTGHSIFLQTLPFQGSPTVLRAGTLDNFGSVFFQGSLHADTLGLDFPAPDLTGTPDSEHLTVHPFPLGRALVS